MHPKINGQLWENRGLELIISRRDSSISVGHMNVFIYGRSGRNIFPEFPDPVLSAPLQYLIDDLHILGAEVVLMTLGRDFLFIVCR